MLRIIPNKIHITRPFRLPLIRPFHIDNSCVLCLLPEIGSKWLDCSRYRNNGAIVGAILKQGRYGAALQFDGVNDYVNCGNDASLNPTEAVTVETWIKLDVAAAGESSFIPLIFRNSAYLLRAEGKSNGNKFSFFIYAGSNWELGAYSNFQPTFGVWYHVVGTYDRQHVKIYVNGKLKRSSARTGAMPLNEYNTVVGFWNHKYFPGLIDEVRIYNRALSAEEVKIHYQSNLQKYNSTQWYFQSNITNLSQGNYTYYGWANDSAGNSNYTYDTTEPDIGEYNSTSPRVYSYGGCCDFSVKIEPSSMCGYLSRTQNYILTVSNNMADNTSFNISVLDAGSGENSGGFNSLWASYVSQIFVAGGGGSNSTQISITPDRAGVFRFKVNLTQNNSADCWRADYGHIKICSPFAKASKNISKYNETCQNVVLTSSGFCQGNQTLNKIMADVTGAGNATINLGSQADLNSTIIKNNQSQLVNPIQISGTNITFGVNSSVSSQYFIYFANNTQMNQTRTHYFGLVSGSNPGLIASSVLENPCKLAFYTYAFEPNYCNIQSISSTGSKSVGGRQFTGTIYWWLRNDSLSTDYLQCNCNYSELWVVGVDPF